VLKKQILRSEELAERYGQNDKTIKAELTKQNPFRHCPAPIVLPRRQNLIHLPGEPTGAVVAE